MAPEVAEALAQGRPVVALETTLLAHGLPRPLNREVAREIEASVREEGAVPATIGVLDGVARIGLTEAQLDRLAAGEEVAKLSARDLGPALAAGVDGATTVAATIALGARSGIRVMATGGLGGVHLGAERSRDVSADLSQLRASPVMVVASGVKSVLDVRATLEELETLGVPVIGYRSRRLAGFLIADGGQDLAWSVDSPEAAAAVARSHWGLGPGRGGLLLSNPVGEEWQLDPRLHRRLLEEAVARAGAEGVVGGAATPFLLQQLQQGSGGRSVEVNRRLVLENARLAAQVARALHLPQVGAGG